MARSARKRSPSGLYHVLLRAQREGLFASDADKRAFLAILEALAGQNAASLCAYCLMDDHVHLLLYAPQGPEKLARPLCARYAAYFNQSRGLKGKVFYDRFMSQPVEEGEDLLRHIRFIHMNPVRARMVFSPGDYAFSSYRSYTARRGPGGRGRAGRRGRRSLVQLGAGFVALLFLERIKNLALQRDDQAQHDQQRKHQYQAGGDQRAVKAGQAAGGQQRYNIHNGFLLGFLRPLSAGLAERPKSRLL